MSRNVAMLTLLKNFEMNHRPHKGGVDAKELFHLYVVLWIQDKRLHLLDFCKFDKVSDLFSHFLYNNAGVSISYSETDALC